MKVSEVIALLQTMPQDLEVEVNDHNGGEIYPIDDITHYIPDNIEWPEDSPAIIIQVNS